MATDMLITPEKGQQKKNVNETGRSVRSRSSQFSRSDQRNGVRNNRGPAHRDRRRPVFNGRNSTPRHSSSGGRGLYTRNIPRTMTMDVGPPGSLQTFRPPLPMNNPCNYNSNFNSSRSMTYNNQSLSDRLHENTNRAFNSHIFQRSFPPGAIPANHVQFPFSGMRRHHRYNSTFFSNFNRLDDENWFSNRYRHRRMPSNQSWCFPTFTCNNSFSHNNQTSISNSSSNRGKIGTRSRGSSRRDFSRSRRGGSSVGITRNYLRNNRPRPVSRAKRYLRWKNNYRDLQRAIRCYFRLTSRDPLGLDDICRENRRRDNLGLTPLRGDSAMNTPAYSLNTPIPHRDSEIPSQPHSVIPVEVTPHHQVNVCASTPREESQEPNGNAVSSDVDSGGSQPVSQNNTQRDELSSENLARSSSDAVNEQKSLAESESGNQRGGTQNVDRIVSNDISPRKKKVVRDKFHQRHRNVVTVNTQGNSRFSERTVTGNYHNYYTRRPTAVSEATFRQYVESRRCLDIGCNSGEITLKLAEMNPISIEGIDSDGHLIQEANRELEKARRAERNRRREDSNQREPRAQSYFNNVSFRTADYVPDGDRTFEPQYDTIIALSVTKWIHMVYGDSGIQRFFRRVYEELREGGYFLVEPQMLSSYRKSYQSGVHYDPDTQLQIKPPFDTELLDMGFTSEGCAIDGRPNSTDFRSRCIYIYTKKAPEAISTNQLNTGYPRPPPCYYYPSPVYRGLISSQPSSSLNFPLTPSQASPTGSYLNEAPGPSHVITHEQEHYSSYSSDSEDYLPPAPSGSREHSSPEEGDDQELQHNSESELGEAEVQFDPVPLNYVLPIDEESSAEDTNSGAMSEASTSASQSGTGIGRSSLKMRLRRLDHPNGSFSWTIDGSRGYDSDEDDDDLDDEADREGDDLIFEADDDGDEIFDEEEYPEKDESSESPWDLSDRRSSEESAEVVLPDQALL